MSYTQQNLTDGTVLTAAHLNHVDDGIVANEIAVVGIGTLLTAIETILNPSSPNAHRVTLTLSHVTSNNAATSISDGGSYQATLAPNAGYELSTVSVTMGGTDITATAYSNGVISIASVTGDIVITATATQIMHSVTETLSHVTSGNATTSTVPDGSMYQTTLTPNSGYELSTVSVTMGGTDITATAYSNGVINIANVTGDIVITATATQIEDALGAGKLGTMRLGTRNA